MRILLTLSLLAFASPAAAQSPTDGQSSPCVPSSHFDKVIVTMADRTIRRGSLLCIGADELMLGGEAGINRFHLDEVWKVRKAADPIWDGALKGAAFGLLPLIFGCPAQCVLRITAAYGAIGLAIDAIDTNRDSLYSSAHTHQTSVAWHVRFR
jgi:hypothetical protein